MTLCLCGKVIGAGSSRCRSCAMKRVQSHHVNAAFGRKKITYGAPAKPSPCPCSWWVEVPDLFYQVAAVRAGEMKGRERISE